MTLSAKAQELFAQPVIVHVGVVADDGVPHITPIWADIDADGNLWFNTAVGRKKDRYLAEGAPIAIEATAPDNPYDFVLVRGTVGERRFDTAEADIDTLAKKYMGVDSYPMRQEGEQRVTIVVNPTEVVGG